MIDFFDIQSRHISIYLFHIVYSALCTKDSVVIGRLMHIACVESYMRQFEISRSAFILSNRKRHFRAILQGIVGTVKPRAHSKFQMKYVFSIVELSERKIPTEQYCTDIPQILYLIANQTIETRSKLHK